MFDNDIIIVENIKGSITGNSSRNKEVYQSSVTDHTEVKLDFLRETVKNVSFRLPDFEGDENRPLRN